MRKILLAILFLNLCSVSAQDLIIDYNQLSDEVLKQINSHRKTLKIGELKEDPILFKAAQDHSIYMNEENILSHEQMVIDKKFPKDRIKYYQGNDFNVFGENVLYTTIDVKHYSKTDILALAKKVFIQWKRSPPHYRNMISKDYELAGIAFSFDKKTRRLYATNVFGAKGVVIPNQLSNNAFGLSEKSIYCKNVDLGDQIHIGNGLRVEGDDVILYYYDIEKFKRIFKDPSDAIAIDFIEENQFQCASKNNFDVSLIYDGVLSKPIYRNELLSNNSAKNDFKIITKVGKVPEHLKDKNFTLNMVFIFNNCACEYAVPIDIKSRSIALFPIIPIVEIPKNTILSNKGIIKTDEHSFAFERNKIVEKFEDTNEYIINDSFLNLDAISESGIIIEYDTLSSENFDEIASNENTASFSEAEYEDITEEIEIPFTIINETIHSTQIYSYSSIEGNEELNQKLYQERAIAIENFGKEHLDIAIKPSKIIAKENWETCYIQLEMENLGELATKSKEEIRNYINTNKTTWEGYLDQQRVSKLIANYYGEIETKNPNNEVYLQFLYEVNLRTGIYEKDYNRANLALAKLYDVTFCSAIFDEIVFSELMTNKKLVQNACAALIKHHHYNHFKTVQFLKHWLNEYDTFNKDTQHNLLNLYCVTNEDLLNTWDVSTTKLANVTKPKSLEDSFELFDNDLNLTANYNYVALYYANHINDSEGTNHYFKEVYSSFKDNIKSSKDRVSLGLFLNHWNAYYKTIPLLKAEMKKPTFSKEEALLLAQTYAARETNENSDDLEYILKKAYQLNKNAWCNWQKKNKNLLRNTTVKAEFCKMCN
jgi:uncharacterized protein YkwD